MEFMGVIVETGFPRLAGGMVKIPGAAYEEVRTGMLKPTSIRLVVGARVQTEIIPFSIFGSRPYPMDEANDFVLEVPVKWSNNGPLTRETGKDNTDVILLNPVTRHFVDIQVSTFVRRQRFFIATQKIWEGWMVGSTMEDLKFVPSAAEHAYPGSDYPSIWKGMGEVMKFTWDLITKTSPTGQPDAPKPVLWAPPAVNPKDGWIGGVVEYFNMVTGTGMIRSGAKRYFVHFSAIDGGDPVRTLAPMKAVEFNLNREGKIAYVHEIRT
ncbi:MAG: cold shock domain-containing protein [Candidatus Wildermuthbacteria bacterium]|nr:cold shock domain-containing protein [Candidatus Wildermuthbacteria bacterium]